MEETCRGDEGDEEAAEEEDDEDSTVPRGLTDMMLACHEAASLHKRTEVSLAYDAGCRPEAALKSEGQARRVGGGGGSGNGTPHHFDN